MNSLQDHGTMALLAIALGAFLGTGLPAWGGPESVRTGADVEDIQVLELPEEEVTCFLYETEFDPMYNAPRAGMSCVPTAELSSGD